MKFTERIIPLREERHIPQRQFAAAMEIDTATYCKIEKSERRAKAGQIVVIAELLQTDKEKLLALWLADQVAEVVEKDKEISDKTLNIVKQNINKNRI